MYGATSDISTSASAAAELIPSQSSSRVSKRRPSAQILPEDSDIQWRVYLFTFCAALNSAALGYDFAINTNAGPLLWEDLKISEGQLEFFMGSLSLAAVLGSALSTTIADAYGRLTSFAVANVLVIAGLAIVCLVSRFDLLILGRCIMGLGIGIILVIGPIYIAEIAPPLHRGWFVSWHETGINTGVILAYATGLGLSYLPSKFSWRLMFAAGGLMPVFVLLSLGTVMIESPRWLLRQGKNDKAAQTIGLLFGKTADTPAIMSEILTSVHEEMQNNASTSWRGIFCPTGSVKYMLIIGVLTCISQQVVGIEPVMMYMQIIIKASGEDVTVFTLNSLPLIVGIVKLILVPLAGRLMDVHGRRTMMIISFSGLAVTSAFLATMFHCKSTSLWLLMNVIILYVAFFSIGAGPGAWLLTSELFSNTLRVRGMCIATLANRVVAALEVSIFLSVSKTVGLSMVFVFFGVTSLLYALFCWTCLIETKSQTLEQITEKIRAQSGTSEAITNSFRQGNA